MTSMRKWENIDATGRELGRGWERESLVERVAREVGTSLRIVHDALRESFNG